MSAETRRREIVRRVTDDGMVRVADLATEFAVSGVTVRTDLAILERQGLLLRVIGGAVQRSDPTRGTRFRDRLRRNARAKGWIAQRAASLVEDGDSLFIDASSTAFGMIRGLRDRTDLMIFTNGLEVASAAADLPSAQVILFGGQLRRGRSSLVGPIAARSLTDIRVRKAFVSCSALSFESGLMQEDIEEAELKRWAVEGADRVIALVDSTKLASTAVAGFAPLAGVSDVLVDELVPMEHVERLRRHGVAVTVCGEHHATLAPADLDRARAWRIGFANLNDEIFATEVRRGLERAAQAAGIDLLIADNAEDPEMTVRNVEYFIQEKADLVIEFLPFASYGEAIMARFREAGIPVIAIDIPLPGATFFGVDNYRAGRLGGAAAGAAARDRWGDDVDRVIALELPRAGQPAAARMAGMLDALREILPIPESIVSHVAGTNIRADARRLATDLLRDIPTGSRTIWLASNDELGIGAIEAYRAVGRSGEAIVMTQGADHLARRELANPDSPLVASVAFVPEGYGDRLIPLAQSILEQRPVPPAVFVDHEVVTRASHPG